jgi:molecular chaperone Hsp33
LVGKELKALAAGGFFIQPLPDADDAVLDRLEKNLAQVRPVSAMVADGLDARGIIAELLRGFSIRYLTETDLAFRCQCSKARIEEVLMSLGEKDLDALVQDGKAEVGCQFCGEKYQFDAAELIALRDAARTMRRVRAES